AAHVLRRAGSAPRPGPWSDAHFRFDGRIRPLQRRVHDVVRSLVLLAVVIAVLVVTSATTPVVAAALGPGFAPARVYDRVFEVLLAVAVVLAWRRLDLGRPMALGLGRAGAGRTLGRGIAVGIAGLAVGLALCWAGGALSPALRYPAFKTVGKVVLGLGAAVAIGIGEEALFRGVLLQRATLDFGRPT